MRVCGGGEVSVVESTMTSDNKIIGIVREKCILLVTLVRN